MTSEQLPAFRKQRRMIKDVVSIDRPKNYSWDFYHLREEGRDWCWEDLTDWCTPGNFAQYIESALRQWWHTTFRDQFRGESRREGGGKKLYSEFNDAEQEKWYWVCSLQFESYKIRPIKGDTDKIKVDVVYSEPVYVYVATFNGSTMAGTYNHLVNVFTDLDVARAYVLAEGERYGVVKRELMEPGEPTLEPEFMRR